ncbi:MAG: ROK family transcriptional regulator [Spirochaetia bacterium]|nr:ROK family transcriptional regulator [Spirochaetia bacterium]
MLSSDPEAARTINRLRILNSIRSHALISRAEISRDLHLNKMTVSSIVEDLIQQGLIKEKGKQENISGRKGISLSVDPEYGSIILVDAGLWKTRLGITDSTGKVDLIEEYLTSDNHEPDFFFHSTVEKVEEVKQNYFQGKPPLGLSVSLDGLVDPKTGTVKHSPNWGWHQIPAADMLSRMTGISTTVDNNVRCMLLGEQWFNNLDTAQTVIYINWAHGIGSAIMHDQIILQVDSEFGHIPVADTRMCSCGKVGCLEAHASGRVLQELGGKILARQSLSVKQMLPFLDNTIELRKLFRYASTSLGKGIASVANMMSPDLIIIGGGISQIGSFFLDVIRSECERNTIDTISKNLSVRTSHFGDSAGIMGTAALGLNTFIFKKSLLHALRTADFSV